MAEGDGVYHLRYLCMHAHLGHSLCRLETELAKAGASAREADEVRREVRFTRRNSGALQVDA